MAAEPGFEDKLRRRLRAFSATARHLVGVSSGRDSVALLHGLLDAGFRRLIVCHLDHGLRGAQARADARFVGRLSAKHGLPFETTRVDVAALARREKLSVETAAREARYRFFAEVAGRRRCHTLFLAHHADDQVETFLFNLLRGAGPAGLAAMAADTERTVGRRKLRIVRPLLSVWRSEIDTYVEARGLRWRDDPTNADPAHGTRNRLRLEVLPLLARAMGRDVKGSLWRAADLLAAEAAWLDEPTGGGAPLPERLPLSTLLGQPLALQRRALRAWLLQAGVTGVGYQEVERVRSLLNNMAGPAKVNLPGDRHARRKAGVLFVEAPQRMSKESPQSLPAG